MNCRTFAKTLYDYLDGTLADPVRAEFELHRSGCARCAARMESESRNAKLIRTAVQEACDGLDFDASPRASFISSPQRFAGWRIAAAIAALLIMAVLVPTIVRKAVPESAKSPLVQSASEDHDSWVEEIHVKYEIGLMDEMTLISHDSGITTIIEIQVSYQQ